MCANSSRNWGLARRRLERADALLQPAGAAIPVRQMAGRHRAGHRADRQDREQFQRLEKLFAAFRAGGEHSRSPWNWASSTGADLDRLSFADWLREQGIDSPLVQWYMNYCCRDDYGAMAADTSAWAGVHYFASRAPEEKGPLTWPEGNGWITAQLLKRVGACAHGPDGAAHRARRDPVFAGDSEATWPRR